MSHPDQYFGETSYSQCGEDIVVLAIFHSLGILKPSYVDVGAHHPFNISNTALLYERGCRGINIEANPNLIEEFFKYRPDDLSINVGVASKPGRMTYYMVDKMSGRNSFDKKTVDQFCKEHLQFSIIETKEIKVATLNSIIDLYIPGGEFPDYLTIDIEGLDYEILESTRFSDDNPKVICVEIAKEYESSSKIKDLLDSRGYIPYVKLGYNVIFVKKIYSDLVLR